MIPLHRNTPWKLWLICRSSRHQMPLSQKCPEVTNCGTLCEVGNTFILRYETDLEYDVELLQQYRRQLTLCFPCYSSLFLLFLRYLQSNHFRSLYKINHYCYLFNVFKEYTCNDYIFSMVPIYIYADNLIPLFSSSTWLCVYCNSLDE